ncbi:hypothetical protein BASA81_008387 [Batrachochytrium salamandrivorans]|nr:hypothetical protein BASA81_008387 [Batrachochytrium salamandrivorans]
MIRRNNPGAKRAFPTAPPLPLPPPVASASTPSPASSTAKGSNNNDDDGDEQEQAKPPSPITTIFSPLRGYTQQEKRFLLLTAVSVAFILWNLVSFMGFMRRGGGGGGRGGAGLNRIREEDGEDPSGLASYKLRPSRPRYRLKASQKPKFPDSAIAKQVVGPYTNQLTKKRTFGCLRDECRGLAMEDLTDRKWRMVYKTGYELGKRKSNLNVKLTLMLTDGTELTKFERDFPETFKQLISTQEGKTYIEAFEGADAIGGNKGQQLRTKERFVQAVQRRYQAVKPSNQTVVKRQAPTCTFNSLQIQPSQYRLYYEDECNEFQSKVSNKYTFILKPETGSQGSGITFHKDVASVRKKLPEFFPCRENVSINAVDRYLVQEYIAHPLLLKHSKFDARVYLFLASSQPWLAFYREGYLRRSLHPYTPDSKNRAVYLTNTHYQSMKEGFKLSDHIWTFDTMQDYLTRNGLTGPRYVDSILNPYIKRVANFVFQSAKSKLTRRRGSFHVFGLDFMIDERFRVHFIESNGYPGFTWSINYDTRGFVTDLMDLVLELHEAPAVFERMRAGDNYGGFQLIYNEVEEEEHGIAYDPCFEFFNNERSFDGLKAALRRFSKYTGYAQSELATKDSEGDDDGVCNKVCKNKKKLAAKEASKLRHAVDRLFENLSDEIEGTIHLGGSKDLQLVTVSEYLSAFSCSNWNLLGVAPQTYRWDEAAHGDCGRAVKFSTPSQWIGKPVVHTGNMGSGFRLIANQERIPEFLGACANKDAHAMKYIVQRRIGDILTVNAAQWSLRAYLLLASTQPWFVFFSPGFARSVRFVDEEDQVVLGEREITMEDYQYHLSHENIAGSRFVQTHMEPFMKRVGEFLFRAARTRLQVRAKTYQLVEMDFVLDEKLRMWYIGTNSAPLFSRKVDVTNDRKGDFRALILELADTPEAFAGMRYGDSYGPYFSLVYSEYDEYVRNVSYDPCKIFKRKWAIPMSVAKKANELHDVQGRSLAANERELRKYTNAKWLACRQKGNAGATCAAKLRNFFMQRYEIFLDKQRTEFDSPEDRALKVEEWLEIRLAEKLGEGTAVGVTTTTTGDGASDKKADDV